ncbi:MULTISPECIES: DUF309 domain-containing protein [unclassified Coleofasciculus]|uniref:DUF309 domain-containing protein n=1 Tax=Cyanophyceae TaxID=3028117 RepID=UPI0016855114|nr:MULTISPECIES: DUF309 domain-containing protein [unclassified Coleofasciculus]MBD1878992.1 DUF309 domain-containing protein [Coleofasciculus sp. FACHB-T130]MBD1901444.1 DUF309 domain-containing protein [Coleofasciculus sp. FACHB-125]MBD2087464.1 DUF309 domain-containing protein [Coleofasciculus sp. FACHB-542]
MTEEIPSEFWQGIEEFNQHEFYACHDTLEALWMEASEPEKRFYQGVLQIAVGCYHLGNLNWRGAVILLGEGMRRLEAYEPAYSGIDVTELREQSAELLTALQQAGAENVVDFVEQMQQNENASQLPKIVRVEA